MYGCLRCPNGDGVIPCGHCENTGLIWIYDEAVGTWFPYVCDVCGGQTWLTCPCEQ